MSTLPVHFTGNVSATTLAAPTPESPLAVYVVTFSAGAHTHWHTHPKGQGLYVTDGVALVLIEGQTAQRLTKGESIWIDAGRRHWHGAAPGQPMTHVAYQQAADDLSTIDWHDPVAPTTYAPFYVWRDIDGMRQFCWGEPGYSAIVRDFGRHSIKDWPVHQLVDGPADFSAARSLTVKTVPLPTNTAPSQCIDDITAEFLATATDSTVARVTAVDVTTWTAILVELSTHEADQSSTGVTAYEVLHVSTAAA